MPASLPSICHILLAVFLAPLLPALINRIKALFAGRRGAPLLQGYYDLAKLLRKGAVYSHTTTWVFRLGPIVGLAAVLAATPLLPLGGVRAVIAFPGDLVLMAYLLGLMRFMTMTAALDTGSAFEGMGASREAQFSALAEPALMLSLAALALRTGHTSLSAIYEALSPQTLLSPTGAEIPLVIVSLSLVLLTENARIPVDDPNTHLELTMIHEVMVLDHGGPDFALIQYAGALKMWIFATILSSAALPFRAASDWLNLGIGFSGVLLTVCIVGIVESVIARLRLLRVPQMLLTATVLAILSLALTLMAR